MVGSRCAAMSGVYALLRKADASGAFGSFFFVFFGLFNVHVCIVGGISVCKTCGKIRRLDWCALHVGLLV